MPFKSEKQRRFLWSQHPDIAKRWAHEYPKQKNLPMYAHEKENNPDNKETEGKEAQITTAEAVLKPILAQFAPPRELIQKKSNSILEPVQMPQIGRPTYAQEEHHGHEDTGPNPVNNNEDNIANNAAESNGSNSTLEMLLCSKGAKDQKQEELNKIAQILRKKAIVLSHPLRTIMQPILSGIQAGMEARKNVGSGGNQPGGYGNGNGVPAGVGSGGLGAQGTAPNGQGTGQGIGGNGQGMGGNSAPASPQSSFLPRLVGTNYESYLQSARSQLTQARMNSVIPPPMGSQAPSVVASFPGMNSAPKTASVMPANALKPIQPINSHFQASNIVAKNQSQFAKGNDGLLNTIGKLSPFKTIQGKIDGTAGIAGGAYGNLPNTPKDIHKG